MVTIAEHTTGDEGIYAVTEALTSLDTNDGGEEKRYDCDTMIPSESETVELKKSTAQLGRALKAACAFANHKGGTIYFGISDHGEIIGQDVSDATLKKISSKIRQKIKPGITIGGTNDANTISNKEYQVVFGISRNTASTDLNGLVEHGIIKRTEEGGEVQDICSNEYAKIVHIVQKLCKKQE